jgi:spore germination cell wall hydrolase CwlJ-like protein
LTLGVGLTHRIVQTQKRLETVQFKLDEVSEVAIQAKTKDIESKQIAVNLRKELEGARQSLDRAEASAAADNKQVADLKSALSQLNANRASLQKELNLAVYEVTQQRTRLRTAESEMKLQLKALKSDLEAAKQAAVQAQTKATELGEQAIQLRSELRMGKSEREQLRKKLNQAQLSLVAKSPLSKRRSAHTSVDSQARDYLIRTIVFEGQGETEMAKAALVHVILNRRRIGTWGDKIQDVVMRPWQFEPWMTRRGEIEKLSPKDPRYLDAAEIVDSVLAERIPDPTAGAMYFLNPVIVRQRRGGSLPSWADGKGRPIGRHVFYSPDDVPPQSRSRQPQPVKYRPSGSISAG